jgi:tetratricopeptide (TPR) repeat protein
VIAEEAMAEDALGNPLTAASSAEIDAFVSAFLAYDARASEVVGAAGRHPASAMLNAYAGLLWLLLEAPVGPVRAAPFLARARSVAAGARERLWAEALTVWSEGDAAEAQRRFEAIVVAFPSDLPAAKVSQYLSFNVGDADAMLRVARSAVAPDDPHLLAMLAFAYEESYRLAEAEAAARRALSLEPSEPWAQHALAHVMLTEGRVAEGVDFLEGARDGWVDLNSFMVTHLWWHLALFYLSQGRFDDALAAYDEQVWGVDKAYSQDQVGAVSLLARIELAGAKAGDRWVDLAGHLAARGPDVTLPFLTAQYLYGLARADRLEADSLMSAVRAAPGEDWRAVATPLCEGLLAHARGDMTGARAALEAALPGLSRIGGSHAQRDLFEQVWLDSVIRLEDWPAAREALEARRRFDPGGVPLNRALARVRGALGLVGGVNGTDTHP